MTEPVEIVAADIGGTHARFAIARVGNGRVIDLGPETVMRAADHASLQTAWEAFGATLARPLPRAAGIAVACPVTGEALKLTNNPWVIRPAMIPEKLGVDGYTLVNDFEAVAHAVAQAPAASFRLVCGPDAPLPESGVITIVGPGTGMGVAQLHRTATGYQVIATEGGHVDFSPLDSIEDAVLAQLRRSHARVSAERIWVTLERNMQCGNGLCGHCQLGPFIICRDGPVVSYADIRPFHQIKEL